MSEGLSPKGYRKRGGDVLSAEQRRKLVWLRDVYGLDFNALGERYGLSASGCEAIYREAKASRARRTA